MQGKMENFQLLHVAVNFDVIEANIWNYWKFFLPTDFNAKKPRNCTQSYDYIPRIFTSQGFWCKNSRNCTQIKQTINGCTLRSLLNEQLAVHFNRDLRVVMIFKYGKRFRFAPSFNQRILPFGDKHWQVKGLNSLPSVVILVVWLTSNDKKIRAVILVVSDLGADLHAYLCVTKGEKII